MRVAGAAPPDVATWVRSFGLDLRIGLARTLARHCDPDPRLPLEGGHHGAAPFLLDGTVDDQRALRAGTCRREKQGDCQEDADLCQADSCRHLCLVHGLPPDL